MTDWFGLVATLTDPRLARESIIATLNADSAEPLQCDSTPETCGNPATYAYACRHCTLGGFACAAHRDEVLATSPVWCEWCRHTYRDANDGFVFTPITVGA